jgi:hypothetical protein
MYERRFRKVCAMVRTAALMIASSFLLFAAPSVAADKAAQRGEERLEKLLANRTPGEPVSCIRLRDIQSTQVLDGTAIVYEGFGGRLYVNRPPVGADALRDDDILVTKTWTDELCSVDTVRLVDRGARFERGFVGLGKFVPYDRPKRKGA